MNYYFGKYLFYLGINEYAMLYHTRNFNGSDQAILISYTLNLMHHLTWTNKGIIKVSPFCEREGGDSP